MPLTIPPLFGLAVLECVTYGLLMAWMGMQVIKARKRYNVPLPLAYENKEGSDFNRYQRVHANSVEGAAVFFVTLLLSALETPIMSAIAGCVFIFGRYRYAVGYYEGVTLRSKGEIFVVGQLYLVGATIYMAVKLLMSA